MSDNGPMAVSRKSAVSLKVIASYAEEAIVAVAEDRSLERGVFPVIFPDSEADQYWTPETSYGKGRIQRRLPKNAGPRSVLVL